MKYFQAALLILVLLYMLRSNMAMSMYCDPNQNPDPTFPTCEETGGQYLVTGQMG